MKKFYTELKTIVIGFLTILSLFTCNSIVTYATEESPVEVVANTEEAEQSDETEESQDEVSETEVQTYSGVAIVEISNYEIGNGILAAGKDISIILNLHNLSSTRDAESVMLTISSDSGMIYPSYGNDNQIFVGDIPANESIEVAVPISVSPMFVGDAVDLKCQFDYVSANTRMTNNSAMIITASGGNKINVNSVDVSTHAIVNGKSLVSISYSNKSNANITDAKLFVEGNVSEESKQIDLGTVYSGKSYSKDLNVTFTQTGNQSIVLKLGYTDGLGEYVETNLGEYSVSVNEQAVSGNVESNNLSNMFLLVVRVLAPICLIIAIYTIVQYIRKR